MNATSVPELKKLLQTRFAKSPADEAVIDGICDDVQAMVDTAYVDGIGYRVPTATVPDDGDSQSSRADLRWSAL